MKTAWGPQMAAVAVMAGAVGLALTLRGVAGGAGELWAETVEAGGDHITVADFTERILAGRGDVVLVDLRPQAEFDQFHLVGAARMDLPALLGAEGEAVLARSRQQLVVLMSSGMTHPGQAWVELWRRGHRNVRVLEGGLSQLQTEVLTPPSLRGPTTAARAQAEARAFAETASRLLGTAVAGSGASRPASRPAGRSELATDPPRLVAPTVVSTAWVAQRGRSLVVLDARERAEDYARGHLPGALHAPVDRARGKRGGFDDLLPTAELARLFGGLGIAADSEVVVYSGEKLQDATLLILALVGLGHERVAVMDGGFGAWQAEGRPVATDVPAVTARSYVARPELAFAVPLAAVVEAWRSGNPRILDVRPTDGFRGEKSTEARPGHIPGSLHRSYTADVVARDGGVFLRAVAELGSAYQHLGLPAEQPVVVTCRTGHQASQTWFLLRYVLGHREVRWFDGSWQEWAARSDLPAETGEMKR